MQPIKGVLVGVGREADAVRRILESRSLAVVAVADPAEAIALLGERKTERYIFLFEPPASNLAGLSQLKTAFPDDPIVALLANSAQRDEIMQALRAGAAQVALLPASAEDLGAALDNLTSAAGKSAARPSLTIAVSEVSDGAEAAALAFNLAYEISHLYGKPCIVAETWERISRLPTYLNLKPRFDADNLIEAGERVDRYMLEQTLVPFSDNLAVLPGPSELKAIELDFAYGSKLIGLARQISEIIVLEAPARFSEPRIQLLKSVDQVVLVGKQALASVQNLKKAQDTLRSEYGIQKTHLVVNGYDARKEEIPLDGMREILGAELVAVADPDNAMFRALENAHALRQEDAKSLALADLDELARRLIGAEAPLAASVQSRSGFLGWLSRAFGG